MKHPFALLVLSLSIAAGGGLLFNGCTDDPAATSPPPALETGGTLTGSVFTVDDLSPLEGIGVALLERVSLDPVDLTATDAQGRFALRGIPAGDYIPVLIARDFALLHLPRAAFHFEASESVDVELQMVRTDPMEENDLRIEGRVVDAETDEPIAFARVEMNFIGLGLNWSEFRGTASSLEPVTDRDGRFVLDPIPLIHDPFNGTAFAPSWRVTARGYKARSFPEEDEQDIQPNVKVRLFEGEDDGVATGRVLGWEGQPVAGVPVAIEWRRSIDSRLKSGPFDLFDDPIERRVILPGGPVLTDADGRYRIEGLPDGAFIVKAGPYGDDGWVGTKYSGVELSRTQREFVVPDLLAAEAIENLSPEDGLRTSSVPALRWTPDPRASVYTVTLFRAKDDVSRSWSTSATEFQIPRLSGFFSETSVFLWWINGFDADNIETSRSDRPSLFTYDPGATP